MQSCYIVSGPTSHLKMTRTPGFFCERKWYTNSKMHHGGWGLGTRLQNADTCVFKEPKYRGLDGEDNECRLCKHCGCMLNTDYIWLHKSSSSEKFDCTQTRNRKLTLCGLKPEYRDKAVFPEWNSTGKCLTSWRVIHCIYRTKPLFIMLVVVMILASSYGAYSDQWA